MEYRRLDPQGEYADQNGRTYHAYRFRDHKLIDDLTIQEIGREMTSCSDEHPSPDSRIELDFSGVEYLSSMMLGKLITLEKRRRLLQGIPEDSEERALRLVGVQPEIYETFAITRLNQFFEINEAQST